jgi:hypothetical protein
MFAMRNVAGRPTIGPFKAWILLDNDTPRVMAYLEPPFADTFGSVEPFPRQGAGLRRLPDDLLAALGRAGELFFGREAVNLETLDTVHEILDVIQPELGQRLQAVAPDFFSWALRDDHRFDASSTDC